MFNVTRGHTGKGCTSLGVPSPTWSPVGCANVYKLRKTRQKCTAWSRVCSSAMTPMCYRAGSDGDRGTISVSSSLCAWKIKEWGLFVCLVEKVTHPLQSYKTPIMCACVSLAPDYHPLGQGGLSSACIWRSAWRVLCHVSTSNLCVRSPLTNSDSPPGPPGAQSRCAAPAPLKDTNRDFRTDLNLPNPDTNVMCVCELTWCVSNGGGGPDQGGEAVCRMAFCSLLLLFLSVRPPLQSQRHRGLAVGAGETWEEDSSDALPYARRTYVMYGRKRETKREMHVGMWFRWRRK